jgi:hypothetical protein
MSVGRVGARLPSSGQGRPIIVCFQTFLRKLVCLRQCSCPPRKKSVDAHESEEDVPIQVRLLVCLLVRLRTINIYQDSKNVLKRKKTH